MAVSLCCAGRIAERTRRYRSITGLSKEREKDFLGAYDEDVHINLSPFQKRQVQLPEMAAQRSAIPFFFFLITEQIKQRNIKQTMQ